jgi:hypothetical protein
MSAYTYAQWKAVVRTLLSDRPADDALFALAVSHWVQAQAALQQFGDEKGYALHLNSYKAKRRRLLGYSFSGNLAALQLAVKTLMRDPAPSNDLFAQACAAYVKAEIAREVNRDPALYDSMRRTFLERRLRLAGFAHAYSDSAALQAAVNAFLPVDAQRLNTEAYVQALTKNAVADLQGFGTWIDAQIEQAKADIVGLGARVDAEIRQGMIDLQNFIPALAKGHITRITEDDVQAFGNGVQGSLPDMDMQITAAHLVYVGEEVGAAPEEMVDAVASQDRQRKACFPVPWRDRHVEIAASQDCTPRFAFSPQSQEFVLSPPIRTGEHELELTWNGIRIEWQDTDVVLFDEEAAKAVSQWVNKELSTELGDPLSTQREYINDYVRTRRSLYLKMRAAGEIRAP